MCMSDSMTHFLFSSELISDGMFSLNGYIHFIYRIVLHIYSFELILYTF